MAQGYLIFHLNLAFSSIQEEARPEVIRKCYWPLLRLAESTGIPVGIELTGWTLSQIHRIDSGWVEKFRTMLEMGQCELIGSGWSQLIGPLVPYEVNRWNQQLGLEAYQSILGVRPSIALVNEMAFSTGMVDVYIQAGYRAIIMDRDNVRLALGLSDAPMAETPTHALGCGSESLPVLWSDSILFQRLQRVVHGDIPVSEYQSYLRARRDGTDAPLPIYCNDAEIFDYRPGRFTTEGKLHSQGEWTRMETVLMGLREGLGLEWICPSDAVDIVEHSQDRRIQKLTSVQQPVPVKKQAKYNINRWALTGRDNMWLNTQCHRIHQALMEQGNVEVSAWKQLCELWASDLRTHITEARWQSALKQLGMFQSSLGLDEHPMSPSVPDAKLDEKVSTEGQNPHLQIEQDEEGIYWTLRTPCIELTINARRGMTIRSLAFKSHNLKPVIGTLNQGYFDNIQLGADYYSGGVLVEIPGKRQRFTDLEWIKPAVSCSGDLVTVTADLSMGELHLVKTIEFNVKDEAVTLGYRMDGWARPLGSIRVAKLTLIPESFLDPIALSCKNGGPKQEQFLIDQNVEHSHAVSPLVSSTSGFGATDGQMILGSKSVAIELSWNPAKSSVVPFLLNKKSGNKKLTRVMFSLAEMDDTSKPGGHVSSFAVTIRPHTFQMEALT